MPTYEDMKRGYANLWAQARVRPEKQADARAIAARLARDWGRYDAVSRTIGCPWWWVAVVHQMESGARFSTHLHNGDPLTARTTHVPAGRPLGGNPPFTWETSALDALRMKALDKVPSWDITRCLYEWERYNGFGYIGKINSPYLWSYTNLEQPGKYIADHVWDPDAVSKQCGAAAILISLIEIGAAELPSAPAIPVTLAPAIPPASLTQEAAMSDLTRTLQGFAQIAPTLAAAAGGPLAVLAVKALAEALGDDVERKPEAVAKKIEDVKLSDLISALGVAEQLVKALVPAEPVATIEVASELPAAPVVVEVPLVPAPPVNTQPTNIDTMIGGEWLTGWKTIVGIALFVAANVVEILGIAPGIFTPAILEAVMWVAGLLAGVGAISKVERYIAWFKKPVQTSTLVVATASKDQKYVEELEARVRLLERTATT
jgi:lysozyme family protein